METWVDIVGFEGLYQVSDFGRVRSLDREVPHAKTGTARYKGRILSDGKLNKDGYPQVQLRKFGKSFCRSVHRLVAQNFIRNPKNLPMVRHLDDVPINNHKDNLAWGTMADNSNDMRCWNCGARRNRPKGLHK